MRHLYIFFIFMALLSGCCFSKKHTDNRITKTNSVWLPDSCYKKYVLVSNVDTLRYALISPKTGYLLSIQTSKCSETLTESQKNVFSSPSTKTISFEHESSNQTEGLNVAIDKVMARYDFDQGLWASTVNQNGRILEFSSEKLDSFVVANQTFKPVMMVSVTNTQLLDFEEANVFWIAPHYGVIRFETQGGKIFNRQKN